ncbi:MAG: CheR family methyltransferase [Aeromonadaceae bacterium]
MNTPELSEPDFLEIRELMSRVSGIKMAPHKRQLVAGRLLKRLREHACDSFHEYVQILKAPTSEEERRLAVDLLTTNETFFFREEGHFRYLGRWLEGRTTLPLRVWSAACSSGEEIYSLAMVLQEARPAGGWELLGSDLCRHVLAKAQQGIYPMSRAQGIPEAWLKRYCLKGVGEQEGYLQVASTLRSRVQFSCINLNESLPLEIGMFDVIFLRNILIYFDMPAKQAILARIAQRLKPDGLLFIGHSESLQGLALPLIPCDSAVYCRSP